MSPTSPTGGRAAWRDHAGHTLIEIVAVLSILGIFALVSFATLGTLLQVGRAKGASEEVAEAIRETRQLAISETVNHRIILGGTTYEIRKEPYGGGDVVKGPATLSHNASVSSQDLTFTPFSAVDPLGPTTITVTAPPAGTDPACAVNLTVTPTGAVTLAGPPC